MKILIFGLVAILCIQVSFKTCLVDRWMTKINFFSQADVNLSFYWYFLHNLHWFQAIHANAPCEEKLANLIKDGETFLTEFKKEHDVDRAYVKKIGEICAELIGYLNYYGGSTFGKDLQTSELKAAVALFTAGFFEQYLVASDIFTRLVNGINILKELAACLVAKYALTCKDGSNLSGCEADLNAISCALLQLTDAVPPAAKQALGFVDYLQDKAIVLYQKTRTLNGKYLLACESCVGGNLPLSVVKYFFKDFIQIHDKMHVKFDLLNGLCDTIFAAIDAVTSNFLSLAYKN